MGIISEFGQDSVCISPPRVQKPSPKAKVFVCR